MPKPRPLPPNSDSQLRNDYGEGGNAEQQDRAAATLWYARLFGRSADSRPMPQVAEWEFPRGGWLQLYESAERAGKGSLTLAVTDVEQQVADLQKCGLEAGQPIVTGKVKVVMIKDPDGNSIAFAEALDPSPAR